MAQFTLALPAMEIEVSDETLKELDDIWPGPGGEAPVASGGRKASLLGVPTGPTVA